MSAVELFRLQSVNSHDLFVFDRLSTDANLQIFLIESCVDLAFTFHLVKSKFYTKHFNVLVVINVRVIAPF